MGNSSCCSGTAQLPESNMEIGDGLGDRDPQTDPMPGKVGSPVAATGASPARQAKVSREGSQNADHRPADDLSQALRFDVTLDRTRGDKIGMDVDHFDGERLLVATIASGGLVERWNETHPDRAVKPDDTIAEVNGIHGNVKDLIEECSKHNVLNMKFLRY